MSTQAATQDGQAPQPIQSQGGNLPASIFKNEGVDTSAKAVERNELGVKSGYEAPVAAPTQAQPTDPTGVQPPTAAPVEHEKGSPDPVAEKKLLAGKYTSVEELEKGYLESQRAWARRLKLRRKRWPRL